MATIKDVAAKAGVSTATVSHVINGSRTVTLKTRNKVKAAIAELKYRPDGIARSLRVSQTGTVAALIPDITNPFFAEFVRGVQDFVDNSGERYNVLLCNTEESPARERRALDLVTERRIDGMIIAPTGDNEEMLADFVESGFPLVLGDRKLEGNPFDTVVIDNRAAGAQMAKHLLSLGHRRFGVLQAALASSAIDERVEGFAAALKETGVELDSALVVRCPSTIADGETAGLALLDAAPRPEAIFCTNNFMTLGMIQAVATRNLDCPEDIAVVGVDDFPWAAAFRPRLTVMSQPAYEIGREAAGMLFDRISGRRTGEPVQVTLAAKLIVRESCGAGEARQQDKDMRPASA